MSELIRLLGELHSPEVIGGYGVAKYMVCSHCFTGDPFCTVSLDWPCPTMEILLREAEDAGDHPSQRD